MLYVYRSLIFKAFMKYPSVIYWYTYMKIMYNKMQDHCSSFQFKCRFYSLPSLKFHMKLQYLILFTYMYIVHFISKAGYCCWYCVCIMYIKCNGKVILHRLFYITIYICMYILVKAKNKEVCIDLYGKRSFNLLVVLWYYKFIFTSLQQTLHQLIIHNLFPFLNFADL